MKLFHRWKLQGSLEVMVIRWMITKVTNLQLLWRMEIKLPHKTIPRKINSTYQPDTVTGQPVRQNRAPLILAFFCQSIVQPDTCLRPIIFANFQFKLFPSCCYSPCPSIRCLSFIQNKETGKGRKNHENSLYSWTKKRFHVKSEDIEGTLSIVN